MRRNKLLLIFLLLLTIACKKKPIHVYLYTEEGVEVLNGSVRGVFIGDSESADDFYKAAFDEKGNIDSSTEKVTSIYSMDGISDTSIDIKKIKYSLI